MPRVCARKPVLACVQMDDGASLDHGNLIEGREAATNEERRDNIEYERS